MQQQMGMAPMRQDMQYRSQPFQGFQGMPGLQGLQRLLGGLGGREDFAQRVGNLGQQTQPPPLTAETNRMYSGAQQMEQWRNRQRDEKQRAEMPQQLDQGIGGREDRALPGTGQTQPREMGAGFPGGPPIGSPGAAEQRAKIHAEQIAQPAPLKGAPPLTPTKIPPGTGGIKPAPPPASTPPPPGQIGVQPQAPTPPQQQQPAPLTPPPPVAPPYPEPPPREQDFGDDPLTPEIKLPYEEPRFVIDEMEGGPVRRDFGGGRWGSIHDVPGNIPSNDFLFGGFPPRSPWGRGPSRRQPFPPMMPRFGGGMPRGMGMPYGGGGPYGNLWGGGGGGWGQPQMPRFGGGVGGGYGGGMGGIGGFPGMGGGGYGGGFGGGYGMPQMPRFGGGFGGGMPGFGGGFGGGMRQPQNRWNVEPPYDGGFGGMQELFGGGW